MNATPIPSFPNRQMPPPSSSPHHSHAPHQFGLTARSPLSTLSTSASRSTSNKVPSSRPGNNMSISSIMGSDSPTILKSPSLSPLAHRTSEARGHCPLPLAASPSRSKMGVFNESSHKVDMRRNGYSNNLFESSLFPAQRSSNQQRISLTDFDHVKEGMPPIRSLFELGSSSRKEGGIPARPYSQPNGLDLSVNTKIPSPTVVRENERFDHMNLAGRRTFSDDFPRDSAVEKSSRDRSFSDFGGIRASPRNVQRLYPEDPHSRLDALRALLHEETAPSERENGGVLYHRPDIHDIHADRPIASREGPVPEDRDIFDPKATFLRPAGPPVEYMNSQSLVAPTAPQSLYAESSDRRIENARPGFPSLAHSRPPGLDVQLRKSLEESQVAHRPILGQGQEGLRRIERGSPLPQAVQGASSQPAGSGRDPSIKSEFGRMFSGLGSGVGSTPQPMLPQSNESLTPVRQIVAEDDDPENMSHQSRREEGAESLTNGLRTGKRAFNNGGYESDDGRHTPGVPTGSSAKRSKLNPPSHHHHHHHHQHGPQ